MKPFSVGVVGCGRISEQYLTNLTTHFSAVAKIAACADLNLDAARAAARTYGVERACLPEEVYEDPDIDVILNLTNPWAHTEVNLAALAAGKHVYAEKPLALTRADARRVLDAASAAGMRIGCAPDTFLGAGLQTCVKLVDEGWIGTPTLANAQITMSLRGNAAYNSDRVGGVLMDMAPYFLTALVALLGPADRVVGFPRRSASATTNSDMASADYGASSPLETPTTVAGTLLFGDVPAHLTATVDSHRYGPVLSVVGTEGVLTCNDPNMFGGPVLLERHGSEPKEIPLTHRYADRNRGIGLIEMMASVEAGRPHRANGEFAYHVVDIAQSLLESADGRVRELERVASRPERLPPGHTHDSFT